MYIKKGIIDRIEGNKALISLTDGQILWWEMNNLPADLTEGGEVVLEIKNAVHAKQEQQELAREILNEVFNTTPQTRDKVVRF